MTQITDRIFLGNYLDAQNEFFLIQNNIGLVINVAIEVNKPVYQFIHPVYKKYFLDDIPQQSLIPYISIVNDLIVDFLQQTNKNILIHCRAGISRSASLLIAHLMIQNKWSFQQAYQFVKQKRNIVNPNPGFVYQLELFGKN